MRRPGHNATQDFASNAQPQTKLGHHHAKRAERTLSRKPTRQATGQPTSKEAPSHVIGHLTALHGTIAHHTTHASHPPALHLSRTHIGSAHDHTTKHETRQNGTKYMKISERAHARDDRTRRYTITPRTRHTTHGETRRTPRTAPQLRAGADADLEQLHITSTPPSRHANRPKHETHTHTRTRTQITPVDKTSRRECRAFCRPSAHSVDSLTPVPRSAVEPDRRKAETK